MSARIAPPWLTTSTAPASRPSVRLHPRGRAKDAACHAGREERLVLRARRYGAEILAPSRPRVGVMRRALLAREALEDAEPTLAQVGIGRLQGRVDDGGDDACGLQRA